MGGSESDDAFVGTGGYFQPPGWSDHPSRRGDPAIVADPFSRRTKATLDRRTEPAECMWGSTAVLKSSVSPDNPQRELMEIFDTLRLDGLIALLAKFTIGPTRRCAQHAVTVSECDSLPPRCHDGHVFVGPVSSYPHTACLHLSSNSALCLQTLHDCRSGRHLFPFGNKGFMGKDKAQCIGVDAVCKDCHRRLLAFSNYATWLCLYAATVADTTAV